MTLLDTVSPTSPTSPLAAARLGGFGGQYVPDALMPALHTLEDGFQRAIADPEFTGRLETLLRDYVGRPTPLSEAPRLSAELGVGRVLLKREDLAHTGSHKINNALGQCLLAQYLGKTRVIAETGAGQHGVATATAAALLGLECTVLMGEEDTQRQSLNVARMRLLGAQVEPVLVGTRTLKDAMSATMREWVTCLDDTHYVVGTVAGPHPFPAIARWFQTVIGIEARAQVLAAAGRLPDAVLACVGGGSNALGIFSAFLDDQQVELLGLEAGGRSGDWGEHSASLTRGTPGVLHGARTYVVQDAEGQTSPTHSVAAGLDYPGVGPEHAFLADTRRARYASIGDADALAAMSLLARTEGIICALESAHAVAGLRLLPQDLDRVILLSCSGRGDKDTPAVVELLGLLD